MAIQTCHSEHYTEDVWLDVISWLDGIQLYDYFCTKIFVVVRHHLTAGLAPTITSIKHVKTVLYTEYVMLKVENVKHQFLSVFKLRGEPGI